MLGLQFGFGSLVASLKIDSAPPTAPACVGVGVNAHAVTPTSALSTMGADGGYICSDDVDLGSIHFRQGAQ